MAREGRLAGTERTMQLDRRIAQRRVTPERGGGVGTRRFVGPVLVAGF